MKRWKPTAEDYIAARTDVAVRNRIVESNMGLAHAIARQHHRSDTYLEELVNVAVLGMIHAFSKYQPSLGKFSNYAATWMHAYCIHFVRRSTSSVSGWCRRSSKEIEGRLSEAKTDRERTMLRRQLQASQRALSIDSPEFHDGPSTLGERLHSNDDVCDQAATQQRDAALQRAIGTLSDRERYVIRRRLRGATLEELGRERGVSRERIRQVEATAIDRMRFVLGVQE